jgi:hypothetical protein
LIFSGGGGGVIIIIIIVTTTTRAKESHYGEHVYEFYVILCFANPSHYQYYKCFKCFSDLLIQIVVFWVVTTYSLGGRYQCVIIFRVETDLQM